MGLAGMGLLSTPKRALADAINGDLTVTGSVGIGTTTPQQKLEVAIPSNGYAQRITAGGVNAVQLGTEGGVGYATLAFMGVDILMGKAASRGIAFGSGVAWPDVPLGATDIHLKGNVGIGTAAPGALLHVKQPAANTEAQVIVDGNHPARGAPDASQIQFRNAGALKAAIGVATAGAGIANGLSFQIGGAPSDTSNIRMLVDSSGNVGVGTTTPNVASGYPSGTRVVTVQGNGSPDAPGAILELSTTAADGTALPAGGLDFVTQSNTAGDKRIASIRAQPAGGTANNRGGFVAFHAKADGGTMPERMRIDQSGNVGVGTSAPTARLHVTGGSIKVDDRVIADSGGSFYAP
jgi:hypothetical protein